MGVDRIVNCGGISVKNRLVMQIYADVMGKPQHISRSAQTPALGSAIAGSVVAGESAGGHATFASATASMTGVHDTAFAPIPENQRVYDQLFALYRRLHDSFGIADQQDDLYDVMKKLLDLRDEVRA